MGKRRTLAIGVLLGEAVRAVARQRGRSALTALGIAIGIAAVVWVVAIGHAGSARAEDQLRELGDNLVWVEAGSRNVNGVRSGTHGMSTLTMGDDEAIREQVPFIKSVSPNLDGSLLLAHGDRNWTSHYRGVTPEYLDIKRWRLAEGERFTEDAVLHAANVCLIGETVRERLFGTEQAVGEVVRIGVQPFEVVGVLARKGQSGSGQDQDDTVMMPYSTVQKKLRPRGVTWLDDIMCSASLPQDVAPAVDQIVELLRQRHHIGPGDEDDFNIRRPEEVIKAQLETSETFSLLLVSVASVALLVGGVGVMNVMLASVAERTREIGVRLAVGATEGVVQAQFLIEAVVLSLFGGLAGVAVSIGGSFAIERVLGWPIVIPMQAFLLAIGFSIGVGVVFGFYPAWRAARLDPIDALRRE
jgi:putative ABC transport system permease protein